MNESPTTGADAENRKCPSCGAALPLGRLEGLCAACLLKQGAMTESGTQARGAFFEALPLEEVAKLFPQLEILALIGKGGMGAVYKARQPGLDRFVALKILASQSTDPGFAERFSREARALAKLSHPNIVAVHEFGQVNGLNYFIMEFVDGVNLRQLEQAGRLSTREALQIVPQICDALQFAHDTGIVHRDIKPENVLMDTRGRVKIADFGIAKIMNPEARDPFMTGARDVMGTPHYMAPEQVERPQEVDHRADIYSLGVVFYELLTGELPLGRFQPPSKKVMVDVRLDEVVLRALEKAPELRYQQASEFKTGVETLAQPPPASAAVTKDVPPQRLSRTALVGAAWAILFFAVVPAFLWHEISTHEFERHGPFASWLMALSFFGFIFPAFIAPLGATLLGWISVAQIRRSGGRLHGMWLAVGDGLLFPLLALDGVIFFFSVRGGGPLLRQFLADHGNRGTLSWDAFPVWYGALLLLVIGAIDFFIIRRVWRAVHAEGSTAAGDAPAHGPGWSALRWILTGAGVIAVLVVMTFLATRWLSMEEAPRLRQAAVQSNQHFPTSAVIQRNGHAVVVGHEESNLHYVLYYGGTLQVSAGVTHNTHSLLWMDHGTVTLPNGRTFGYLRESTWLDGLQMNGKEYDLREGRALVLQDDGTARQLRLFPPRAEAEDAEAMGRLVKAAQDLEGSADDIRKLNGQLEAARAQLMDLQKTHAPTHEKVKAVTQSIATLEAQIRELTEHPGESLEQVQAKVELEQMKQVLKPGHPNLVALEEKVKAAGGAEPKAKEKKSGMVWKVSAPGRLQTVGFNPERWQIAALVAEGDSAGVEPGEEVDVTLDAFRGAHFKGWVAQVSPVMERVQNVATCRTIVEVVQPDPQFKPGMTAWVDITLPNATPAFGAVIEPVFKSQAGDGGFLLWALNLGSGLQTLSKSEPAAVPGPESLQAMRGQMIDVYAPVKAASSSTLHCMDMMLAPLGPEGWDLPAAEVAARLKKAMESWNFVPVEVDIDARKPHAFLTREGARGVLQIKDGLRFKLLLDGSPRRPPAREKPLRPPMPPGGQ